MLASQPSTIASARALAGEVVGIGRLLSVALVFVVGPVALAISGVPVILGHPAARRTPAVAVDALAARAADVIDADHPTPAARWTLAHRVSCGGSGSASHFPQVFPS